MDTKELYREILNEHNINPTHKKDIDKPSKVYMFSNFSFADHSVLTEDTSHVAA